MQLAETTSNGRTAALARRGVVAVGGVDATLFLNDLVTADITVAGPGRAVYAALLTPQGKVLFDFIVFRDGDRYLIDVPRGSVADFLKRLAFYRLRSKVTIDDLSDARVVLAGWGGTEPPSRWVVAPDPRLPALGWRALADASDPVAAITGASEADYDAHRIGLGIPEGGLDFDYGAVFPHDVGIDQLGGLDITKGCYVGQEVVTRIEHRGTARRRVVVVRGTGPLPMPGTAITAGEQQIGTLMSSFDGAGLATVRLDRAKEAIDAGVPVTAAGTVLALALPGWAQFGWPETGNVD